MKKNGTILLAMAIAMVLVSCSEGKIVVEGDGTVSSLLEEGQDEASPCYDEYFTSERMRMDLVFGGDAESEHVYVKDIYREKEWSGSPNSLIDLSGMGSYFYEVFAAEPAGTLGMPEIYENPDAEDGTTPTPPPADVSYSTLIFSRGFCSLFEEWTTTEEACRLAMAQNQTIWFPMPKVPVKVVLYHRVRKTGMFEKMAEFAVNPADRHIIPPEAQQQYPVVALDYNGPSSHKVDLVFIAEGYTEQEMPKFLDDARVFSEHLFTEAPFDSRKEDFNVWVVENASMESGVDIPQQNIWRNTSLESTFDTFYTDRYLTIFDHSRIADAVSGVPFDAVIVIANETKYGGGGIYNSYAMGTSDNSRSLGVIAHEFGHSFAALADEYFDSSTGYENYYPLDVEPWEPNLTTKVDFDSKWADMVGQVNEHGEVGLYEGGGYVSSGCYRPFDKCMMRTCKDPFCPVCQLAINRMIDYYIK